MKTQAKLLVAATWILATLSASARAGIITHSLGTPGPDPVASGPGLGLASVPIVSTPTPNNDNVPMAGVDDNNLVVVNKRFDFNDYIDIEFTVTGSGGVTEYLVSEFIDNNTGIDWIGYRLQLGTGTGAGFVLAPIGSGLDFDAPLYDTPPTSTAMTITLMSPNELHFTGLQGTGAQQYNVRIDVPDLPSAADFAHFTLRQFPIPIPEPSGLLLAGLAILALPWRRRALRI